MNHVAEVRGAHCLYAQVIRANGQTERKRLVAFHHPSLVRRLIVRLLMKTGIL